MIFLEQEHLRAAAKAKTELGNDGRGLQPAARRRRRHHVAGLVDDVEMHGVATHLAETADGGLAGAHGSDRLALAFLAAQLHDRAKTLDRAGNEVERGLLEGRQRPAVRISSSDSDRRGME